MRILVVCYGLLAIGMSHGTVAAETPKRVQPPEWSKDVLDAFFEDARQELVGERPTNSVQVPREVEPQTPIVEQSEGEQKWSQLVDADTLTAEVKRLNNQLSTALRRSSTFNGGGNLACRRDFGMLATLFGVIAEFDGNIRWQDVAAGMRSRCLQASRNCKVASSQSLADAQKMQSQLEELLRGQAPEGATSSDAGESLADRELLMQAMEFSLQEQLSPALANSREFRRRAQTIAEQAQLLAVLAEAIKQSGYEYSDDDDFLAEAIRLREAASNLSQAAKDKNYEAARAAAGRVGQSCSNCHEGYRG